MPVFSLNRFWSHSSRQPAGAPPRERLRPLWLRRRATCEASAPAGSVLYAIGDVHGCADLLEDLLAKITLDARSHPADMVREIIFLGDYVDRGPDSRRVIDTILAVRSVPRLWKVTALKGNHEDALQQFLRDASFWPTWSRYGAIETLLSYGVPPPPAVSGLEAWIAARDRLEQAIPPDHMDFFDTLEMSATRGDYFCVHAGVRPNVSLDAQDPWDFMTIRDPFMRHRGRFEKVIVHAIPWMKPSSANVASRRTRAPMRQAI